MKTPGKMKFSFNGKSAMLTRFEIRVLMECMKIPKGSTSTYSEIAKKIGKPKASRAVANALGKNPFAPLIPCHRVIRSDGSIGGYSARGGAAKKARMLLSEGCQNCQG
jgi:methylated-DNA-[protein]-cysteine S-methyltransferase